MIASYPDRYFQLWEYKVSHGSLLVRSPRDPDTPTNIDLIFAGVEFIGLPRHLRGLELWHGTTDDAQAVSRLIGRPIAMEQVFVFVSEGNRFPVVAAGYKINENQNDIFDSPFA